MEEKISQAKPKQNVAALILAVIVVLFGYAYWSDSSRNDEINTTKDPARLAYLLLDYADKESKSSVKVADKGIEISFNLGDVSASSEFDFLRSSKYVMQHFFANFPDVESVSVIGTGAFTDIKGQKTSDNAFVITMSSSQAKTINWENVEYLNLPTLAERYWRNPAGN